jgi:hypothetical protein
MKVVAASDIRAIQSIPGIVAERAYSEGDAFHPDRAR